MHGCGVHPDRGCSRMDTEGSDGKRRPERSGQIEELRRRIAELEEQKRRLQRRNGELVVENTVLRRRLGLAPAGGEEVRTDLVASLLSILVRQAKPGPSK